MGQLFNQWYLLTSFFGAHSFPQGIPFQDQYYGKYMHEWGAPQHDPWVVVAGLVVVVTVAKYLLQRKRHYDLNELVKMTQRYKTQVNAQKNAGEDHQVEYVVHGMDQHLCLLVLPCCG